MPETHRLLRRQSVWYYRRRVPEHLVPVFGKSVLQFSLGTRNLKEAKRKREIADIEWSARFAAAENRPCTAAQESVDTVAAPDLSSAGLTRLVWDYVERMDERFRAWVGGDPPENEEQKAAITTNIEIGLQILENRDDPRADERVDGTSERLLRSRGLSSDELGQRYAAFSELVRRALLELDRRRLAHFADDHRHDFFDQLFSRAKPPDTTFGELANQCLELAVEEASANATSRKWLDKQTATLGLIREIVGDETPVRSIDYDACLRVRSTLARVPANRSKHYKGLPLERAIAAGEAAGKPGLSPTTQEVYLAALRDALDLVAKKGLIAVNPAQGLRPLRRDDISDAEKRIPFTPEQISAFFTSEFYQRCATSGPVPYCFDEKGWRFWLPLICLFSGMRPNEVCQLDMDDVRLTAKGIWYFAVLDSNDEEDGPAGKTLKTGSSRRRVPIHPELVKLGLLRFVEDRRAAGGPKLFRIKPDAYGNYAAYPLKRFRDDFLPRAIALKPRQSFYSFRHNFRDALRRIGAPPDALQALGGWSQGRLVSDNYGDKSDPDYQARFIRQIAFAGLDLSSLHVKQLE